METTDRQNYIERLKDALHETDYQAIKYAEGWYREEEYAPIREYRQGLRDEINRIEAMSEEEFLEEFKLADVAPEL